MPLQPYITRAPGFGGLNLEGEEISNSAHFAKTAKNLVFDNAGRLASRKGYSPLNDTVGADAVDAIFVYDSSSGSSVITAMGAKIYETTSDETNVSLSPAADNWQFQNFNDKVVGAQGGETMVVYEGSTDFNDISGGSGTVPNGNCVHSAFGRLWTTDNNKTVLYWCGLLDETEWDSAGTSDPGEFNILGQESAVRSGYDEITAISHFEDKLVVFLENSIVILDGPEDPANMIIFKTIDNIGCIARDSVQQVGNDLVFLSRDGLRSIARAIREDNFPLRDLSRHVRGDLLASVSGSPDAIKSAYYPDEGIYILLFTGDTAWVFDFKVALEGGLPRVTTWDVPDWHSIYYHEGTLYIGQLGEYGKYDGYTEDGANYQVVYQSLNVDFDSPNLKMAKTTRAALSGANAQTVTFTYEWDYGENTNRATTSLPSDSTAGVYGTDDWGTAVYGDGISRGNIRVSPFGSGYLVAFGLETYVESIKFTIEQIAHFAIIGRLAR